MLNPPPPKKAFIWMLRAWFRLFSSCIHWATLTPLIRSVFFYYIDWCFACFPYTTYIFGGHFDSISSFVERKTSQTKEIWEPWSLLHITFLSRHWTPSRRPPPTTHPHTHSHGRDKWVQLTDTHLMSGRLDLGWLMRVCLTDSIGQWKHESETWETCWPRAPGPHRPQYLEVIGSPSFSQ